MRAYSKLLSCLAVFSFTALAPARADMLEDVFGITDAHGLVPINTVIDAAREVVPGMVVEAELEKEHGRWVYEVEVITPEHKKVDLIFDAHTGAIISVGKKHKRA